MAVLSRAQAASASVQLLEYKTQVESYFAAAKAQIFRGFAYTPGQATIASNAAMAEADFHQKMGTLDTMITSQSYQGRALTSEDMLAFLQSVQKTLDNYQAQVVAWNASSPLAIVFDTVSEMFNTAKDTMLAIQKGFAGFSQTLAKWIPYVPWIIVGALVLPSVLRIISKKRREGTDAALDYTADEIESGRRATAQATGRAAITAAKLAI